jgi:hypothetical protein
MASDDTTREQMRRWVETWKQAGPELEAIWEQELRSIDRQKVIGQLFQIDQFRYRKARRTSGLVEQQAWFAKLRASGK